MTEVHLPQRVLVVDDEEVIREVLADFLTLEGFQVSTAANGEAALAALDRQPAQLVISDLKMPGLGGLGLLSILRERHPEVVTLIMTGYGTVETAIEAMKRGAFDYVLKPFKVEEVMHTVQRALEQQRLRAENIELKAALSLAQLAARLGDEVELSPTLRLIGDTVREQVRADRVSVILLPDEDTAWEGAHAGEGPALTLAALTDAAARLTSGVLCRNGACFEYLRRGPATDAITALALTPLVTGQRRLGFIAATRDGGGPFAGGAHQLLTILADRAAVAVHNAQLFETLERTFRTTIEAFVNALEDKDRYTAGHSERVAEFACITAAEMGFDEAYVQLVHRAGRLHDIGKLTLRTEELNKP
ncbi:MAG: response regulator, partial [Myxococcales bacterium]|nr:response regulator [Myxococcales bacterium]